MDFAARPLGMRPTLAKVQLFAHSNVFAVWLCGPNWKRYTTPVPLLLGFLVFLVFFFLTSEKN